MSEPRRSDDWFSHILEDSPQDSSLTIQAYGALLILACDSSEVQITHVSENIHEITGISIDQALHHPLSSICEVSQWWMLVGQAQHKHATSSDDIYSYAKVLLVSGVEEWMVMHAVGPSLVCELIPLGKDDLDSTIFLDSKVQELHKLLSQQTDSIFRTAQVATDFINDALKFHRCVLYRFELAPGFGEIIAESFTQSNPHQLVPFLGLRFPPQSPTDDVINIYKKIKVRVIAEVFDSTSLIISKKTLYDHLASISPLELPVEGRTGAAQDLLIHSVLRGATTAHEEQLIAMGIRNCMTGVLIVNGSLWGAVQCINIHVKTYSWPHRIFLARATELLSSFISDTLLKIDQQETRLIDHYCRHIAFVHSKADPRHFVETLLSARPDLMEMVQRDVGVATFAGQSFCRIGNCPPATSMKNLVNWLTSSAYEDRPDACRFSASRQRLIIDHLKSIQWPKSLVSVMEEALTWDWKEGPHLRLLCWESLPDSLIPHIRLDSPNTLDGVLGMMWLNVGNSGEDAGLFFFRAKADDSGEVLQKLSSSILNNSLVRDTVERYAHGWGNKNKSRFQCWSSRQLIIFHLLISLLRLNIHNRSLWHDIARLRGSYQTVNFGGRMILNSSQAQVVFRKTEVSSTHIQYHCLTANEEFAAIFGPLTALHPAFSIDGTDWEENEWDKQPLDLLRWFGAVGLDVVSVCGDGELVVKQQSLWSKTKGHIKATLLCRFLYGVNDANAAESVYCLDIRDDSMSSRVENALIYAHDQLKKSEKLKQELVGTVSHELRTPLTAIMGFHEVLSDELTKRRWQNTDTTQCLQHILDAATHLLDIVTNLLDLSKYEMTSKKRTRVDLITVVQEACRWVANTAAKRKITVACEVLTSTAAAQMPHSHSGITSSDPLFRQHSAVRLPQSNGTLAEVGGEKNADGHSTTKDDDFVSHAVMGLDLSGKYLHEPPMNVFGDTVCLKRIFVNLLDNAIKFSFPGGRITVSVRWIPSISFDQNGFINVVVQDEGIGIATENLTNIFRPFYQVDLSSHREHTGVGLGLSIVRQLVELHKGRISVHSKLSQGTRFDLTFPSFNSQTPEQRHTMLADAVSSPLESVQYPVLGSAASEAPPAAVGSDTEMEQYIIPSTIVGHRYTARPPPRQAMNLPDSSTCIMIVDDSGINRRLLHRMLSVLGYSNIVEAEEGREALSTLDTLMAARPSTSTDQPVSLMFLDIQMPVLDGPDTARTLREKGFTFPIIAFSASTWTDTEPRTFNGVLSKPINGNTLKKLLAELLHPNPNNILPSKKQQT